MLYMNMGYTCIKRRIQLKTVPEENQYHQVRETCFTCIFVSQCQSIRYIVYLVGVSNYKSCSQRETTVFSVMSLCP